MIYILPYLESPLTTTMMITDESDLTQNKHFDLPLYSGSKRRWAEATENYDVVAIPLAEDFARDACVNYFSADFLFPQKYMMSPN